MSFLKKALLSFNILDNLINNFIKDHVFKTRYIRTGACRQCGSCCRKIILTASPGQLKSGFFNRVSIGWYEWAYNFRHIETNIEDNYIAFTCNYLTPDGKCGNYRWRPGICRNFPIIDYFKEPVFLPECGFSAKLR